MPAFLRVEPPVRLSDAFSRGCGGKSPRGGTTFPPPLISMHGVPSRRDRFSLSRPAGTTFHCPAGTTCPTVPCSGTNALSSSAGDLCSPLVKKDPHHQRPFFRSQRRSLPRARPVVNFLWVNYLVKVVDQTTGGWDDISLMSLGTRNDNGRSCATPAHGIRAGHAKPPRRSSTCGSSPRRKKTCSLHSATGWRSKQDQFSTPARSSPVATVAATGSWSYGGEPQVKPAFLVRRSRSDRDGCHAHGSA